MGGTTAKGAFLTAGQVQVQRSLEVARVGAFEPGSGLPLMIPAIDLIEIGAGGGSIAAVDDRGVIAVGPAERRRRARSRLLRSRWRGADA